MFGGNSSTFGGFGQSTNANAGTNQNNANPFGGFGGSSTNSTPIFGQPQQNNAFGGFGQNANNAQTNASSGFGGFGQTPQSNTSGFGFGSSNNNSGSTAFGSNNAFGSTPSATTSVSTFGNQTSNNLFGNSAGSPAFGSNIFNSATKATTSTGTINPPFAVTSEKEPGSTNATNLFQSITCMAPYANSSFEELRLQDYNQNRRYGNNGPTFNTVSFGSTPGTTAFGQNNLSGQGGGTFGNNTQNNSVFGQPTVANPFGGSTTATTNGNGGMFGGNNVFNSSNTANGSTPFGQNTGNSFGIQSTTNSPFGLNSNNNNNNNTNSFGASNSAASKPFTFGTGSNPSATSNFGQTPATSQSTTAGLFGNSSSAAPANNPFGQAGNTTTNSSIFGNNNNTATPTATTGFSFGATNTSATPGNPGSTSAFGNIGSGNTNNNALKPFTFGNASAPTTGSFGVSQSTTNQKPLSFGTSNTQPSTNLFGHSGNNSSTTNPTFGSTPATGLFTTNNNAQDSSTTSNVFGKPVGSNLFGSNNQSQQSQGLFGPQSFNTTTNSFGTANQSSNILGQPASTLPQQASPAIGNSAYGNNPLFSSMSGNQMPQNGPVATPLVATPHKKKPALLPQFKSTTRSPMASPRSIPLQHTLHHASPRTEIARKPMYSFFDEELLLQTDAFSPRTDIKRLVIDRKVGEHDLISGAVDLTSKSEGPSKSDQIQMKSDNRAFNHSNSAIKPSQSENKIEAVDSQAQAAVPSDVIIKEEDRGARNEKTSNDYWSTPPIASLLEYSKAQLSRVKDFKIGRHGYGQVSFCSPVDLSTLDNIEDLAGGLVVFESRTCTVYPDEDLKPAIGKGLNVSAILTLENCYPLSKDKRQPIRDPEHPRFQQHVSRLKKMSETEFIDYVADTGTWIFRVEHF